MQSSIGYEKYNGRPLWNRCVRVLDSFKYVIDHRLKDTNITHKYNFLLTDACSFYFKIKKLHIPGLNILFDFFFLKFCTIPTFFKTWMYFFCPKSRLQSHNNPA